MKGTGEMPRITLLLVLIAAGLLALFGAQNTETVSLHLLWFPARPMPLWLSILGGAVIGVLLGFLVELPSRLRRARSGSDATPSSLAELPYRLRRALREM